jgi:hypothetical protein
MPLLVEMRAQVVNQPHPGHLLQQMMMLAWEENLMVQDLGLLSLVTADPNWGHCFEHLGIVGRRMDLTMVLTAEDLVSLSLVMPGLSWGYYLGPPRLKTLAQMVEKIHRARNLQTQRTE